MTEQELIDAARALYTNPRTGEWYDSGDEESRIVRGLTLALEAHLTRGETA